MIEACRDGASGVVNIDAAWQWSTPLEGNDARSVVELDLGQAVLLCQMAYGFDVKHGG